MVDTAIFAAPTDDAAAAALMGGPSGAGGFDVVSSSVDHVPLATLGTLLIDGSLSTGGGGVTGGSTYDALIADLTQSDPVADAGEDGPWIFAIPARLTAALASLTTEDAAEVAAAWGATEEFTHPYGLGSDTAPRHLELMATLARKATTSDSRLYLWQAL